MASITTSTVEPIRNLVSSCLKSIEQLYERRGALIGIQTGFSGLDILTNGLQASDLTAITTLSGVGRTTFALNIVDYIALVGRHGVLMFSLGTDARRLVRRLLCSRSRVELEAVQNGFLKAIDLATLRAASSKLTGGRIFIDDTAKLSVDELKTKAENVKSQHAVKLIVVDDAQRLTSSDPRARYSREDELTEVMSGLKQMAIDLDVPVLALCRLTLRENHADGRRSVFSGSCEAASIEEYADVVGLLERTDRASKTGISQRGMSESATLKIIKNENGRLGELNLNFQHGCLRYEA